MLLDMQSSVQINPLLPDHPMQSSVQQVLPEATAYDNTNYVGTVCDPLLPDYPICVTCGEKTWREAKKGGLCGPCFVETGPEDNKADVECGYKTCAICGEKSWRKERINGLCAYCYVDSKYNNRWKTDILPKSLKSQNRHGFLSLDMWPEGLEEWRYRASRAASTQGESDIYRKQVRMVKDGPKELKRKYGDTEEEDTKTQEKKSTKARITFLPADDAAGIPFTQRRRPMLAPATAASSLPRPLREHSLSAGSADDHLSQEGSGFSEASGAAAVWEDFEDAAGQRAIAADILRPRLLNSLRNIFYAAASQSRNATDLRAHVQQQQRLRVDESDFCATAKNLLDHGVPVPYLQHALDEIPGSEEYKQIYKEWILAAVLQCGASH
jgi:hypothetical protein